MMGVVRGQEEQTTKLAPPSRSHWNLPCHALMMGLSNCNLVPFPLRSVKDTGKFHMELSHLFGVWGHHLTHGLSEGPKWLSSWWFPHCPPFLVHLLFLSAVVCVPRGIRFGGA